MIGIYFLRIEVKIQILINIKKLIFKWLTIIDHFIFNFNIIFCATKNNKLK